MEKDPRIRQAVISAVAKTLDVTEAEITDEFPLGHEVELLLSSIGRGIGLESKSEKITVGAVIRCLEAVQEEESCGGL